MWKGDCGGKLPSSSKEARYEEMVLAFFAVEGSAVVVRAESGLNEMDSAQVLEGREVGWIMSQGEVKETSVMD